MKKLWKCLKGVMRDNGVVYCHPAIFDRGILKINNTNTDTVTELNRNLLPQQGGSLWLSCATALDGCIFFMPGKARRIMKLDPITTLQFSVSEMTWSWV